MLAVNAETLWVRCWISLEMSFITGSGFFIYPLAFSFFKNKKSLSGKFLKIYSSIFYAVVLYTYVYTITPSGSLINFESYITSINIS